MRGSSAVLTSILQPAEQLLLIVCPCTFNDAEVQNKEDKMHTQTNLLFSTKLTCVCTCWFLFFGVPALCHETYLLVAFLTSCALSMMLFLLGTFCTVTIWCSLSGLHVINFSYALMVALDCRALCCLTTDLTWTAELVCWGILQG